MRTLGATINTAHALRQVRALSVYKRQSLLSSQSRREWRPSMANASADPALSEHGVDLPLYVRRNGEKYYVTFARKGAQGDLVQYISPMSAQFSLVRAWAERLQDLLAGRRAPSGSHPR